MTDKHSPPEVSVVIPAYNPGPIIVEIVRRVHESLDSSQLCSHEIIVVSDGSSDGSVDLLDESDSRLNVIRCDQNRGKGSALKIGFAATCGSKAAFIDADGDLPPEMLPDMIRLLDTENIIAVVGSRSVPGADVAYRVMRRLLSRIFRIWVRAWIGIRVADTQVGIKAFDGELIRSCLPEIKSQGFAFDVELLWVIERRGGGEIREFPVRQMPQTTSSLTLSRNVNALLEVVLLRIGNSR